MGIFWMEGRMRIRVRVRGLLAKVGVVVMVVMVVMAMMGFIVLLWYCLYL